MLALYCNQINVIWKAKHVLTLIENVDPKSSENGMYVEGFVMSLQPSFKYMCLLHQHPK